MSAPTYVRSGRGGAGNFAPKEATTPREIEMQPKSPADLEAQTDPSDATSVFDGPAPTPTSQYKTYARGGAGNWYEPAILKETGTFTSSETTSENTKNDPSKRSSRVWQGRGGAGNWEADQQMKEELKKKIKSDEEAAIGADIREQAKREADNEIQPPESAHVHIPYLDKHRNMGSETHDI